MKKAYIAAMVLMFPTAGSAAGFGLEGLTARDLSKTGIEADIPSPKAGAKSLDMAAESGVRGVRLAANGVKTVAGYLSGIGAPQYYVEGVKDAARDIDESATELELGFRAGDLFSVRNETTRLGLMAERLYGLAAAISEKPEYALWGGRDIKRLSNELKTSLAIIRAHIYYAPKSRADAAVAAVSSHQVPSTALLAQAGASMLYSVPGSEAAFARFKEFWLPMMRDAGLKNITAEYASGLGMLKYDRQNGQVVRMFLCDTRRMPLPAPEIEKNLRAALESSGKKVIGVFQVPQDPDVFPDPTVAVYYMTGYDENPDHETRLRYLSSFEPAIKLDVSLMEGAGARVAAVYDGNSAFYVGKRLGFFGSGAADREQASVQVEYYTKMVAKAGATLVGTKVETADYSDQITGDRYSYISKVYFIH